MSVGKAFSNTAFWKVDVSVNKYKGYIQMGPVVRASLQRRKPKTRLRLGEKKQYGTQCPESHSCAYNASSSGILRLTTHLYLSTEDTNPVHFKAIIIRYGNATQQRKKTCCSAVYKTKATKF